MNTTSIDTVISKLDAIAEDCIHRKNKAGYFTALYHKVTCQVKEAIVKGDFEDGSRMEKLDTIFANRYIDAWMAWQRKEPVSQSWQIAFSAAKQPLALLLQHLLLGINAHINLDLGIAAAETCKDEDIHPMRRDFVRINAILNTVFMDVIKDVQRVSPVSSFLGFHARNSQSMLINFTIEVARDGAWCFAEELWHAKDADKERMIAERDKEIYQLGHNLVITKGLLHLTALVVRLFEWNNAAKVIDVLRRGKKVKFNEGKTTAAL